MAIRQNNIIRASEINSFLFCQRAWWYEKQGEKSQNLSELEEGINLHLAHAKTVNQATTLKGVAILLFLISMIILLINFLC